MAALGHPGDLPRVLLRRPPVDEEQEVSRLSSLISSPSPDDDAPLSPSTPLPPTALTAVSAWPDRRPLDLKRALCVWNCCLSLVSFVGFIRIGGHLLYLLSPHGGFAFRDTVCR